MEAEKRLKAVQSLVNVTVVETTEPITQYLRASVLWDSTELIKVAALVDFNVEAVDFLMKSNNLHIFMENEEQRGLSRKPSADAPKIKLKLVLKLVEQFQFQKLMQRIKESWTFPSSTRDVTNIASSCNGRLIIILKPSLTSGASTHANPTDLL
ncbi:hypothetical protein ACLB2K_051768 [Fragaria x ananassa]